MCFTHAKGCSLIEQRRVYKSYVATVGLREGSHKMYHFVVLIILNKIT